MHFDSPLADRFARRVVSRGTRWVIVWIVLAVVCGTLAPSWSSIALDGDFDHLPRDLPSVVGDRLLDDAFPDNRTRSQMAVVLGRNDSTLDDADKHVSLDLARRLNHQLGEVRIQQAMEAGWKPGTKVEESSPARPLLKDAFDALGQAISLDDKLFRAMRGVVPEGMEVTDEEPRLAIAYADRAVVAEALGEDRVVAEDREALKILPHPGEFLPLESRPPNKLASMVDVLVPEDPMIGERLIRPHVQLSILRLKTELGEASNVAALEALYKVIHRVEDYTGKLARPDLTIKVTGSAAIGAEAMRASDDAIRYTELFTVLLVLLILAIVYRAPLLVAVPVISIGIAVVVASGAIAWSVTAGRALGPSVPHLEVFVTSRIFVIVIVFGVGTDFCLFLISRLREEAKAGQWEESVSNSLSRTLGALVGSAMTTIVGLGTMILATFGKFYHTGPVIAICLAITLLTSLTFTPALLRWLGPRVFWPSRAGEKPHSSEGLWVTAGNLVTRYPGTILLLGMIGMLIPAYYGWKRQDAVTYDFVSQLSPTARSRQAAELLAKEFPAGETNPISVIVLRDTPLESKELDASVRYLGDRLYGDGVSAVRSLLNPLGDAVPGQKMGMFDRESIRRRILRSHHVSRSYFVSEMPEYRGRLARFDVVPSGDPFGDEASEALKRILKKLDEETARPDSPWYHARYAVAGTTASIQDLRNVTMRDTTEIQISVVVAVLIVLLFVVRRVWLSIYLIFTVLLSYFATLGLTLLFFMWTGAVRLWGSIGSSPCFYS